MLSNAALISPRMVHIHYTRYSKAMMDTDNLYGSFKLIGDAMKGIGLVKDDSPRYVALRCEHVITRVKGTKLVITI
jgi:hypothetical protein